MPRIVVAIASHQRRKPLNIVLRCLPEDWHAVVVVSDEADLKAIAKRPNTHAFIHPNEPLGAKWQRAVDESRKLDPDYLVITGSDDVILGDTDALVKTMEGRDLLVFSSFIIYDGKQHYRCRYKQERTPIGGGRVYSRPLLERMRWGLFNTQKRIHMDDHGWSSALRSGAKVISGDDHQGIKIVALKGDWPQLNSLARLKSATHKIHIEPLPNVRRLGPYQF